MWRFTCNHAHHTPVKVFGFPCVFFSAQTVFQSFRHAFRGWKNGMETFILQHQKKQYRHDNVKQWNRFSFFFRPLNTWFFAGFYIHSSYKLAVSSMLIFHSGHLLSYVLFHNIIIQQKVSFLSDYTKKTVIWYPKLISPALPGIHRQNRGFYFLKRNLWIFCKFPISRICQHIFSPPVNNRIRTYSNSYL